MQIIFLFIICSLSVVLSGAVRATTTINISGEILPETCDIDISSLNQSIDLGEYSVTDFMSIGKVTPAVPFSFTMTNCTAGISAANIRFSGTSVNSTLFALQGGGGDIGLEILNTLGQTITPSTLSRFLLVSGDNTLSFSMRLKSLQPSVTAGDLSGTIFVDIEYE